MRRIWTALAGLCILAGCSGGGGGSSGGGVVVTPGDTTAPTVSLSPSSSSIEGGETIAITASANDAADGTVAVTLACDGGTLTGNLLVTTPVSADATITCTGTATDKAGNKGTATTTITVKKTVATFTSETGASLAQGQLGAFTVTNLPLTATSYAATLGSRTITLFRGSASALNYQIPLDMPAGTHQLSVQIGTKRYTTSLTIVAAPTIADPKALITGRLDSAIAGIDGIIAAEGSRMTSNQRATYQGYRNQLVTARAEVASMSTADANALAVTIQVNTSAGTSSGLSAQAFDPEACNSSKTRFLKAKTRAIVQLLSAFVLMTVPDLTLTKIGGLVLFIDAVAALEEAKAAVQNLVNQCVRDPSYEVVSAENQSAGGTFVRAIAVAQSTGFENKKSKNFRLRQTTKLDESVIGPVQTAFQQMTDAAGSLPYIPAKLADAMSSFFTEKVEYVPSSQVSLVSISNSNILGAKGGSGDIISLVFSYVGDPPVENIPFSFTLSRSGTLIPMSAELVIALPGAEDGAVTLIQGKPITSQLQVRGATSIEIIQAPAHGSATIGIDGLLRYTPSGQYFGTDQLKYRARNENGVSRTATVLFTINRQFEGTWTITSKSVTSSQSPAGLCPNETETFPMVLSKVSDTQYSASFDGVTMTFTMASKDDPNGLRGQISGTYDDGPGETTESLTVNIPNSSQLSGSSTWSYTGPNNSRCSGTTTVTGVK